MRVFSPSRERVHPGAQLVAVRDNLRMALTRRPAMITVPADYEGLAGPAVPMPTLPTGSTPGSRS